MDLTTVATIRSPLDRLELSLNEGEAFLGGGSWLFSEPQLHLTGLVDLTTLGWAPLTVTSDGLSIAATCTFAELAAAVLPAEYTAATLFRDCCEALLGSFKVWNTATVGGNICLALAAGPMTSLAASLDADLVLWTADASRRVRAIDFVTGVQSTLLEPGELLRSIELPRRTLTSRVGFRRIALSPLGRTGTLVIGRQDADGRAAITVSGGTTRPVRGDFDAPPTAREVGLFIDSIDCWYDDAHGAPDWRRAMSARFAEQLRRELSA